mmetsp:Transcript_3680/g.6071  ORF Transcript_3680/g.6071 Transcript_3680/m.6071 type:complete len:138 (-) Transcript_3680:103-516(-)
MEQNFQIQQKHFSLRTRILDETENSSYQGGIRGMGKLGYKVVGLFLVFGVGIGFLFMLVKILRRIPMFQSVKLRKKMRDEGGNYEMLSMRDDFQSEVNCGDGKEGLYGVYYNNEEEKINAGEKVPWNMRNMLPKVKD